MGSNLYKLAFLASVVLALAFTLSCYPVDDDNNGEENSDDSSSSVKGGGKGSSSSETVLVGEKGTFKDNRDDQTYKWVKIGTQTWMAENLNYHEEWVGKTRGNKCYDNEDDKCEKYGRLYEWDDAIRLCPDGWHLPTRNEWNTLISYVGENASKKLKAKSDDWKDKKGTDDYGFGALPGGYKTDVFEKINYATDWWTATEQDDYISYEIFMEGDGLRETKDSKYYQYSVRCVLGSSSSSSSSITYGEFTDGRDEQKYRTVKIGTQTWMADNLNHAIGDSQCYDGDATICKKYGRLYGSETALTACPTGWKLPSRLDWTTLLEFVGKNSGKKLRARSSNWIDNYGTDKYGFSAMPGGYRRSGNNEFVYLNEYTVWWTSTRSSDEALYEVDMEGKYDGYTYDPRISDFNNKGYKYSIRCLKE